MFFLRETHANVEVGHVWALDQDRLNRRRLEAIKVDPDLLQACQTVQRPRRTHEVCERRAARRVQILDVWVELHDVSPGHLAWSRRLSTSQSAHHFMYISLDHGHLGGGDTLNTTQHNTTQYTLHYTSSPAPLLLTHEQLHHERSDGAVCLESSKLATGDGGKEDGKKLGDDFARVWDVADAQVLDVFENVGAGMYKIDVSPPVSLGQGSDQC
jgi:hypothetical protein